MSLRHKFYKPEINDASLSVSEWNNLTDLKQLDEIVSESDNTPVIIFKHSTRCDMSSALLKTFEANFDFEQDILKPYFLDLIAFREISDTIASQFAIEHESPQVILIKNGKATGHASHKDILYFNLNEKVAL